MVLGGTARAEDRVVVREELAAVLLARGVPVSAVTWLLADAESPVEHGPERCVLEVCPTVEQGGSECRPCSLAAGAADADGIVGRYNCEEGAVGSGGDVELEVRLKVSEGGRGAELVGEGQVLKDAWGKPACS